jgi:2-dehydropantoate 2-reductase
MACLFGARLAPFVPVTLTGSWAEGIAAIRDAGILVQQGRRVESVRVRATAWGCAIPPADLALILVKAWQTEEAARHLRRILKPGGLALTLQNGLGNLEALGRRARLGVTYEAAAMLGPGRVKPGGSGTTWIAGPQWMIDLLRGAGLGAERAMPAQIDGLLWGKLAVNCGINALTAILRVRNGELLRRPEATRLLRLAAQECAAVAAARGIALPFPDAAERACSVARVTAVNRSSMLQDVRRGAPTEVEAINGAVVQWGEILGVPTPVNEMLVRLVRAMRSAPAAPQARG